MSNLPRGKNSDYWSGFHEAEAERSTRSTATDAAAVAAYYRKEDAKRARIITRAPWVFASMDAEEVAEMSAKALATRELKELGITPKNSDPVELLDAHHAGREYARNNGNKLIGGSASDAREGPSWLDEYINGT